MRPNEGSLDNVEATGGPPRRMMGGRPHLVPVSERADQTPMAQPAAPGVQPLGAPMMQPEWMRLQGGQPGAATGGMMGTPMGSRNPSEMLYQQLRQMQLSYLRQMLAPRMGY